MESNELAIRVALMHYAKEHGCDGSTLSVLGLEHSYHGHCADEQEQLGRFHIASFPKLKYPMS